MTGIGLLLYTAGVFAVIVGMLAVSALLGERQRDPATAEPYESGVQVTESARLRLSAPFYVVALLFVIFDVEVAFLFTWAVALRELGWNGYLGAGLFVAVLVVGLVYEWREGALDWGPDRRKAGRRWPSAEDPADPIEEGSYDGER